MILDCYAYLYVNHAHNIYPIKYSKNNFDRLTKLQKGDWLKIKGLGDLKVVSVNVDGFTYNKEGKQGEYQEIAIACKQNWKDELIEEKQWHYDTGGWFGEYGL